MFASSLPFVCSRSLTFLEAPIQIGLLGARQCAPHRCVKRVLHLAREAVNRNKAFIVYVPIFGEVVDLIECQTPQFVDSYFEAS